MKLILTCCLALVVSMLFSCTDDSGKISSKISASNTLSYLAGDHKDLAAFKENKMLVAEFSGIVKDDFGGIMTPTEQKIKREELRQRITVD